MADSEKRRFVRGRVGRRLGSKVRPVFEGTVIDLSLAGVCIEQQEALEPGWECEVVLQEPDGNTLALPARVAWMDPGRMVKRGTELVLIYQAGLEFVDLTPEQQEALARILG